MQDAAQRARALMRAAGQAALATASARDGSGHPYVSLVLACVDQSASPVLLLSDLADHAQNLKRDPRAALLFEDPEIRQGTQDPLTRPRVSVLGRLAEVAPGAAQDRLKRRFLARHPGARTYAGFGDFRFYRMAVDSAHLVAGFGQIHWMTAAEMLCRTSESLALAEADLLVEANRDHGAALRRLAQGQGAREGPAALIGIDPEGLDLRAGESLLRIAFEAPVGDPEAVIKTLIHMANSDSPGRQAE